MAEQPKDYVTPQEKLAEQDWAGVAETGLMSMAPADKGWILGVVVMFSVMTGANVWNQSRSAATMITYLDNMRVDRAALEQNRSQEIRRLQEIVKELAQTVAREAERRGRGAVQRDVLDKVKP